MAENNGILASAVIVPELAEEIESPRLSTKRRNSSVSGEDVKRPRLSPPAENEHLPSPPASAPAPENQERRASKTIDERKRGRRLFGALLGTLSQDSSSTAHKRRVDIEKKQQEKLKLRDEEYDHNQKKQQESLLKARRVEQVNYRKQSTIIKHSNMLASANFLLTKAEPKLYYKPWELRPEEETTIKTQLVQVQETIDAELAMPDGQDSETKGDVPDKKPDPAEQKDEQQEAKPETVGDVAEDSRPSDQPESPQTNNQAELIKSSVADDTEAAPTLKDVVDDGGDDVVEGEEDNVIY